MLDQLRQSWFCVFYYATFNFRKTDRHVKKCGSPYTYIYMHTHTHIIVYDCVDEKRVEKLDRTKQKAKKGKM